ncbi:MAG: hypothetical protein AAFQ24_07405 [Pseudomonadota bacterium]
MKLRLLTLAAAFAALTTPAFADEAFVKDCEEFKAANGVDGDCSCMAEKAEEAGVAEEIMATETLDDIDGLSDEAKEVIEACT